MLRHQKLGGFFNRSNEALAAFELLKDLTSADLEVLGVGVAHHLLADPGIFGFHQIRAPLLGQLLELTGGTQEQGDLSLVSGLHWARALGA